MAEDISRKSIGAMIDELITACIKNKHQQENDGVLPNVRQEVKERKNALVAAVEQRISTATVETASLGSLICRLTEVLIGCWDAQEEVMSETEANAVAAAAKQAQLLNAKRNQLIREIDAQLGESGLSVTLKTYDKQ